MSVPRLCLNMIVRNEADRILRALESVQDYVYTFAILDTGSTDDTCKLISDWGEKNNIMGVIGHGAFVNFEQARNQALDLAHSWSAQRDCTYLLLMDADMELEVSDPKWYHDLKDVAYEMTQTAGSVSYTNVRLLRTPSPARYHGVTHEYLGTHTGGVIAGAKFLDHADGSNRSEKYERDIRLLTADLDRDPNNPRTWFYLANTYRDYGEPAKAVEAYRRRVALGGWDEEVWNAQVHLAGCLKTQGLDAEFVNAALTAYQMRPQRSEVLYDLARHFREKGENSSAMLFAERGLKIPRPDDRLFVNDAVYQYGFREEVAIAAYYQEDTRELGFKVNDGLALDPEVPWQTRARARRDAVFYLPKLKDMCPTAKFLRYTITKSPGFVEMNPCVTNTPYGGVEMLVRTVNYKIDAEGRYMIGPKQCGDAPIETENYLLTLDQDTLAVTRNAAVEWVRPEPKFPLVLGLEDMRIFWRGTRRFFYANVREQRADGQCVQYCGELREGGTVIDAIPLSDGTQTEKNWAPFLYGGPAHEFVYRLDTLGHVEHYVVEFEKHKRKVAVDNISGSSQWIRFGRGMLSVVHEAVIHPSTGKRVYQHRFAYTDTAFGGLKLSLPFCFVDVQIEFCAGIALQGNGNVLISFGERDEEAKLAVVNEKDILCALGL